MTKLPRISEQETIKALKKLGFEVARQRGRHVSIEKRYQFGKDWIRRPAAFGIKISPNG